MTTAHRERRAETVEPTEPIQAPGRGMTVRTLWPFLAITFGLTWGLGATAVFFPDQVEAIFGEISSSNPLFVVAVYAPAIAGVLLVLRHHGWKGLGAFLGRLTRWRMPLAWWTFVVVGIPAIVYLGAVLSGTIGDPFPFSPWYGVVPAIAMALLLGPIEELGWRGVALPLLQRRFTPLASGVALGAVWAFWHTPSFLMSGTPQSAWSFGPYVVGIVALSVIMTAVFNASGGSLLVAALVHFQAMNPAFPDGQPWDTLVYVVAAVLVVWLNRRTMLVHRVGSTEVVPGDREADLSP